METEDITGCMETEDITGCMETEDVTGCMETEDVTGCMETEDVTGCLRQKGGQDMDTTRCYRMLDEEYSKGDLTEILQINRYCNICLII